MRFTYFIEPPKIIRRLFDELVWENSENKICLTFDDGPFEEPTKMILSVLNSFGVKGLFFLTGKNVSENFSQVEAILENGHYIANHSYNHSTKMMWMSREKIVSEITSTEKLIADKRNFLQLFRPPYGRLNLKIYKTLTSLNYKIVMWSLLTEDYLNDFDRVKKNLEMHLKSNSIIVFHNNPKSQKIIEKSLDYTINLIQKKGYEIGSSFNF